MFYFKTLEKEEQTKPKASRGKKIIKITVETNEVEKNREKSTKPKVVFSENFNKMCKPSLE